MDHTRTVSKVSFSWCLWPFLPRCSQFMPKTYCSSVKMDYMINCFRTLILIQRILSTWTKSVHRSRFDLEIRKGRVCFIRPHHNTSPALILTFTILSYPLSFSSQPHSRTGNCTWYPTIQKKYQTIRDSCCDACICCALGASGLILF